MYVLRTAAVRFIACFVFLVYPVAFIVNQLSRRRGSFIRVSYLFFVDHVVSVRDENVQAGTLC